MTENTKKSNIDKHTHAHTQIQKNTTEITSRIQRDQYKKVK